MRWHNPRWMVGTTLVVTLLTQLALARKAKANPSLGGGVGAMLILGVALDGAVAIGGLVSGLDNTVALARGDPPSTGWVLAGLSFGLANGVVGGLILNNADTDLGLAVGATQMAVCAWAVATAIWRSVTETRARPRRLTIGPLVSFSSAPTVGVSVQVAGW